MINSLGIYPSNVNATFAFVSLGKSLQTDARNSFISFARLRQSPSLFLLARHCISRLLSGDCPIRCFIFFHRAWGDNSLIFLTLDL